MTAGTRTIRTTAASSYYVIDGRHRVSVTHALGHRDIDAWVTGARDRLPVAA
jgi:hypothetical protein